MIICVSPKWVKILSFGNASAMALFPFILLSEANPSETLLNHEKIHLRQQIELGILPFYIFYLVEFLLKFLKYRNRKDTYMALSFEREAYTHDGDLSYLKTRKWYGFIHYINR